ncbi:MAG: MFS transporter [Rhizobiales bacterium]|nr:MFS transporter [Hyphomicrobiales bacterium]
MPSAPPHREHPVPESAFPESSWRYPGWRVVLTCFVMALFAWGFGFYGHGVYLAELQRLHGWPTATLATASTMSYLLGALCVAFVGDAVRRVGARALVLGGVAAMALATLTLPFITAPWMIYVVYLPLAAGWAALGLGAITNILGLWFTARRGMAISLALNGASSGGIVVVPALLWMSEHFGFVDAMWIATAAMTALLVPAALFWLGPPPVRLVAGMVQAGEKAPISKREALRSLAFWSVAGPFALALTSQVGFIVHQIAFLSPTIGRAGAGLAVAITTVMAVVGRVGLGFVIDRLDQRRASAASFVSQAAALLAMAATANPFVLYAACAVFGFSVGNLITFPALIIQREFDARAFGVLAALMTAVGQFTYAFGPGILGALRDATGNYTVALVFCAAVYAVATAAILMRPKASRSPQDDL